ncbi:hypothetical protein [Propioniciclava soli]|uniref:Uncharacterized protein n=1 Tax=Propioniciclava soli TaxID=2775081 RepID=A0ABZ3CBV3_9ACTN|nr:hypothetical protein [Propioniciclava soli]
MSESLTLRVRESPIGGSRIAFSYLAIVGALLVTGLVWSVWSLFTDRVCGPDSDVVCGLGWWWLGWFVGFGLGTALTAWIVRLGWEWWLAGFAVLLALPAVMALPVPVVIVWLLALPAIAAALTWSGPDRPRWRPWLVVGLAVAAVAASAVSVLI